MTIEPDEIRRFLLATGEEIRDDAGNLLGYVAQPARWKIDRAYLARGGYLVVHRDEETGEFVGTEFDALPHPKTGRPYPAGHSEEAWRTSAIEEACLRVLSYFAG
ncbi:MAG: hypothetical protein K0R39_4616 [Symbiobacteriaceae bacterium]|jgi:hypothetical protein|nr:hypothetical protein [Symbiobacteriaceae bacterium]